MTLSSPQTHCKLKQTLRKVRQTGSKRVHSFEPSSFSNILRSFQVRNALCVVDLNNGLTHPSHGPTLAPQPNAWAIPGYAQHNLLPTPSSPSRRKRGRPVKPKEAVLGLKRPRGRPRKDAAQDSAPHIKHRVGRPRNDENAGGVILDFGKFVSCSHFLFLNAITNKIVSRLFLGFNPSLTHEALQTACLFHLLWQLPLEIQHHRFQHNKVQAHICQHQLRCRQ